MDCRWRLWKTEQQQSRARLIPTQLYQPASASSRRPPSIRRQHRTAPATPRRRSNPPPANLRRPPGPAPQGYAPPYAAQPAVGGRAPMQPARRPAAPVQPAPAIWPQMWPAQRPRAAGRFAAGTVLPGPIFGEDSPFRDGPPDGGTIAGRSPFKITDRRDHDRPVDVRRGRQLRRRRGGPIMLDEQNFDWTRLPTQLGRHPQRHGLPRRRRTVPHRGHAGHAGRSRYARSPSKSPTSSARPCRWG